MDVVIKELGITLMVGVFTILGFEAILHFFFNRQLTGFFQGKLGLEGGESKNHTTTLVVLIGCAFAIGMIVEDLSYTYVDSVERPVFSTPLETLPGDLSRKLGLRSKDDSRMYPLVYDLSDLGEKPDRSQWWLANDLARNGAFHISDRENGLEVEEWIRNREASTPPLAHIKDSIGKLYFYAKNRVYKEPNYYDEVRRIETRMEFARALSLISFTYLGVGVLSGAYLLFPKSAQRKAGGNKRVGPKELRIRVPVLVGILFCVCFFSLWAYARESDEFNKRIFGYYSSMLILEKHEEEKKQQGLPQPVLKLAGDR